MKLKYLKNFSLFFSFFLLIVFTILFSLTVLISIKPVKLNFLDVFDRKSNIFGGKIDEVGDIYISFNKASKNLELIVDNVVAGNFFFPTTLISLDLNLSENFFSTSLKLFDGDLTFRSKEQESETSPKEVILNKINDLNFIKFFSEIEVINNKITFYDIQNTKYPFTLDLKYKENEFYGLLSEQDDITKKISFKIDYSEDFFVNLEANKFEIDFLEMFLVSNGIKLKNTLISGRSEIYGDSQNNLKKFKFEFNLDGIVSYETNFEKKAFNFNDDLIQGDYSDEEFSIFASFPDKNSNFKLGFEKKTKEDSPLFFLKIDQISLSNLLKIWPKNLSDPVFNWMKANSKGQISNVVLKVELELKDGDFIVKNVNGNFDCEGIEIIYMDSMPKIININGKAIISKSAVEFEIFSGESEGLVVKNGEVKLFDLDTDTEKAFVSLDISSLNYNVVNYLKKTTIEKKNYSKLEKIKGNTDLNLILEFPLLVDLLVNQINYKAKANISNGNLSSLYKDFSIEDLNLNINVTEELVNFYGEGSLFKSKIKFNGDQIIEDDKLKDSVKGKFYFDISNLKSIFNQFISQKQGIVEIDFVLQDQENEFKLEGVGSLDNIIVVSDFLGPNLSFENGKVRFLISPYNKKLSGFLDIKTNNMNVEINSIFSDSDLESLKVNNFVSPNQDFSISYNYDLIKNLRIEGEKLFVNTLDLNSDSFLKEMDNIDFFLDVKNLKIGNNKFESPKFSYKKIDNEFLNFNFVLAGEKEYHKIEIFDDIETRNFYLESNYVPRLLNIFEIDLAINTGSLKIEGQMEKGSKVYKGKIGGNNFVFLDAPFFADFISLFSLKGLAQKLKDGGIIFENLNAKYEFSGKKIRIIDSLVNGSELGLSFDTVIELEDDFFLTTGNVIPAYTINTLLTKFPIVGDIVTAGSPEDGLIGASFKIEKINGEYEITYNPISIFVPNLIKNFLTD